MKLEHATILTHVRWIWEYFHGANYECRQPLNVYLNTQRTQYLKRAEMGKVLAQHALYEAKEHEVCNHLKGGNVGALGSRSQGAERARIADGLRHGGGRQHSVIKHQLSNGNFMVICTRCGMKWTKNTPGYAQAIEFETNNAPSSSVQIRFTHKKDDDKFVAAMANS